MIEDIKQFMTENSTMIMIVVIGLIAIIGFMWFQRNNTFNNNDNIIIDKNGSITEVCDMSSGMCMPVEHMTPDQQEMMQQQMQQQQMQQQQMQQQQMQQQQMQQPPEQQQQMTPEEEQMMQQQMQQQQMQQQQMQQQQMQQQQMQQQ